MNWIRIFKDAHAFSEVYANSSFSITTFLGILLLKVACPGWKDASLNIFHICFKCEL